MKALPYLRIVKAVHVMDASAIATAKYFAEAAILLDTRTADRIGGTGIPHDWSISAQIAQECGVRLDARECGGSHSPRQTVCG